MTVCRFYLQGTCRFGNRCRFEHVDPDYSQDSYNSNFSNRRNDYGYQDRYRPQENYHQDRSNKYNNAELSFGPRRQTNQHYDNNESYSKYEQSYRNDTYHKYDYSSYATNQRYSSPDRQNSNSRYDSSFQKSEFRPTNYSNKYDKNQYEWVSDEYKKQHPKKEHGQSNISFSFKNFDNDKSDDINEENMILLERIKEDITAWELGNQWPFTCYSPFSKKGLLPGFNDISFEELRYETLKAQENNSFDSFIENITKAIADVQNRRNKLKQPNEHLLSMIQKLKSGEDINETYDAKDAFSFMSFKQATSEDMADEISLNSQSAMRASSFSFKTALNTDLPATNTSSTSFSFKSILDPNSQSQNTSSSTISFKAPDTEKLSTSMFSFKETRGDYPIYTPIEQLSEQDKEQFSASTFILGKIPTVPPPKVLCF